MEPQNFRNSMHVYIASDVASNDSCHRKQNSSTKYVTSESHEGNGTSRGKRYRSSVRISSSHSSDDLFSLCNQENDPPMTPGVSHARQSLMEGSVTSPADASQETSSSITEASHAKHLWVFGYGSILWKTGFRYSRRKFGYVKGYLRRFWQGNTTHRGSQEAPGRVATLVEDQEGVVWGAAYELKGEQMVEEALDHLGMRECTLGGYAIQMVPFFAKDDDKEEIPVLMFNATSTNSLYMGPSSLTELANQIINTKGPSGHNVEYVTKLADFIRKHIPEDRDMHLFKLDMMIRTKLLKSDVCLHSLEGTRRRKGSESAHESALDRTPSRKKLGRHSAYKKFGRQPSFLDTIGEVFVNHELTEVDVEL